VRSELVETVAVMWAVRSSPDHEGHGMHARTHGATSAEKEYASLALWLHALTTTTPTEERVALQRSVASVDS
jgi:hypothetical protein